MRRSLVALGALVAGWTMIGIPAHATYGARVTADEPQYLLSAISLGNDGDLDISDELADEAYRSFHSVDIDPQTYSLDGPGRQVSPHDPLLPAVLAAPVRIGGWVGAKATLAILAATLAMLTAWTAVRGFGVRPRIALAVVAVFACTAPLATYATQVYPEIPAALAVMAAVAALSGPLDRRGLAACVGAVVVLPWLSIKYAPIAATFALAALWRARDRRPEAAAVGATLMVAAAAYAFAHQAIYGGWTAYATGDHFAQAGQLAVVGSSPNYVGRARRLVGLIVDDSFGIGAWMIGWLALPLALGVLFRRRPVNWAILAMPLAAGWLTATFVASTMHGWWWPGRQLVVVLPIAVIVIAVAANGSPMLVRLLALSGVVGAATWMWTTIEAITRRHVLVVDFDQTANPWMRVWRVVLPDGRDPTWADNVLSVVWVGCVLALVVVGWRGGGRNRALSTDDGECKVTLTSTATVPDTRR